MLVLAPDPPEPPRLVVEVVEGGIGSGACDRHVEVDCHDMEDWAELVDQMEAWPEEPELVDDTDILGRWLKGAVGCMNMATLTEKESV